MGQQQMDGSSCMPYLSWFLGLVLEVCEKMRTHVLVLLDVLAKTLPVLAALPAGSVRHYTPAYVWTP